MAITFTILPAHVNLSLNDLWIEVTSDVTAQNSHTIRLECYKTVGENFDEILLTTLEAATISNKARFNIAEIYAEQITSAFVIPAESPLEKVDLSLRCFIVATDVVDNVADTQNKITSDVFYMLQGGVSRMKQADFEKSQTTFYQNFLVENKRFLTFAPTSKICTHYSPELLFFYCINSGEMNLIVKLYDTDDNLFTTETLSTLTATADDIFQVACGFTELNLHALEISFNKTIKRYSVQLTDDVEAISEERFFVLDGRFFQQSKKIIFKNTLGAYEIVELNARMIHRFEVSRQSAIRNYKEETTSVSVINKMEVSSTWIDLYWKYHLAYLLATTEAYEIRNDQLYKIIVLNDKEVLKDTDTNLYLCTLEYKYAALAAEPLYMDFIDVSQSPVNILQLPLYNGYISYLSDGIVFVENGRIVSKTIINENYL